MSKNKDVVELFENKKYAETLNLLNALIIKEPGNKTHKKYKVRALIELNRLDEALTILNSIVEKSPTLESWELFGILYEKMGRYEDAINAYDQIIGSNPRSDFWFAEGLIFLKMDRLEDALFCIDKSIHIVPDNEEYLKIKLSIVEKLEKTDEITKVKNKLKEIEKSFKKLQFEKELENANKGYKKSLKNINQKLKKNPNDKKLLTSKMYCLLKLKNYEEQLKVIEKILSFKPDDQRMLLSKMYCLRGLKDYEEELKVIEKILSFKPDDQKVLLEKMYCLGNLKKYDDALVINNELLSFKPDDQRLLSTKEYCLGRLDRHEEELKVTEKHLSLNPDDQRLLTSKMFCLGKLGRYKEQLEVIEKILAFNPVDQKILNMQAYRLEKLDRNNEAIAICEKILRLGVNFTAAKQLIRLLDKSKKLNLYNYVYSKIEQYPDNPVWKFAKCIVLISEKKYLDVIDYYESNPSFQENEFFLEQIGYCYEKTEQFSKGMHCYDKLIKINPNSVESWIGKANINIHQEDYGEAVINFSKAYEIARSSSIQSAIVYALQSDGRYSEALKIIEQDLTKNPLESRLLSMKADSLRKMGKIESCLKIYEDILIRIPNDIGALIGIAKTFQIMDKHTSSLEFLDKSLEIEPDNKAALKWKVVTLTKMGKFEKASEILDVIKRKSDTYKVAGGVTPYNDMRDEIISMIEQKIREPEEPYDQISIFPNETYETDLKMEKLFKSLNDYIWIQDGYLDSKTFDYIGYAMHENSTIREIRLMIGLSWNTIDKISSLIKKSKKFHKQYKKCNLVISCSKEFGKNYHDRFIFSGPGEWVWAGASTTTQSTRSTISKIRETETEEKDREEFDRMWNEAVIINEKTEILNLWKENEIFWDVWKKQHDYSEEEAIENYKELLKN